ncbi:MAG: sugar phosphate isomerase/epimerase [Treponema sp.]|nr:sugar phosphate isomerase/epimerase [Treponema sp.]
MNSTRLYLACDNCFAIKRWIKPSQWIPLIKEIGFSSIEASTDNEMDPLFSTDAYMSDWVKEVLEQEQEHSMKVRSFFTGYQTYRTTGLAHPDQRVRQKIKDGWFIPLINHAKTLQADIGFSFHALQEEVLQDPEKYEAATRMFVKEYAELASIAAKSGVKLCSEQMYAPYQPSWTVDGTFEFLAAVYAEGGAPLYTTIDTGHMTGQRKFTWPDRERILKALEILRRGERLRGLWFGPLAAYEKLKEQAEKPSAGDDAFAAELIRFLKAYHYMFAPAEDSDPYKWLKNLGAYSSIIHMQQTDGISASHAPFTPETNVKGIINGKQLLESLAESFTKPERKGMPPKADKIILAFEIFISNVQYPYDGIENLKETVNYWKQFVPRDGMTLAEALENCR